MSATAKRSDADGQKALGRDDLLLRLLRTPPQPRPKREREKPIVPKKSGSGKRRKG